MLAAGLMPGAAQACRLALLLSLDVSSSVDAAEDRLQREGLAAALLAPAVRAAFLTGGQPVALAAYEWSGRNQQQVVLNWTVIDTAEDLEGAAARIWQSTRSHDEFPTALGYGLGYAAQLFARAPRCAARTLDVSGDGKNNEGFGPELAYANFPLAGVTVNALAIGGGTQDDAGLIAYYRARVIRGFGAFVEPAADYTDYERAMARKLERELRPRAIGWLEDQ